MSVEYLRQIRNESKQKINQNFTYNLIFVVFWLFFQVLYFTEAFVDYLWDVQIWLQSFIQIFTFLCIEVIIDNLIRLKYLL